MKEIFESFKIDKFDIVYVDLEKRKKYIMYDDQPSREYLVSNPISIEGICVCYKFNRAKKKRKI